MCKRTKRIRIQALRVFERDKRNTSREYFCSCKSKYKKICKRKRYKYEKKKIDEIERLRFSKPKQFWKYFKKDKSRVSTDVTVEEFSEYFSQLGNENSNHVNQDAESFCDNNIFNDNPSGVYEGLNDPITIPELLIAVKTLKQGKAAGNDCLLNEYFIESIDILCSHVCDIFNNILNTGCYP